LSDLDAGHGRPERPVTHAEEHAMADREFHEREVVRDGDRSGVGAGVIIGLLIVIAVLVVGAILIFGNSDDDGGTTGGGGDDGVEITVPDEIDVNIDDGGDTGGETTG
jgi:hypothetical protein